MNQPETPPPLPLKHVRWFYLASAAIALLALAVIAVIWNRVYNAPFAPYPGENIMTSRDDIYNRARRGP